MRTFVGLLVWLAARARRDLTQKGHRPGYPCVAVAAAGAAILGDVVQPNRAGRLVPLVDEDAEVGRSLVGHWALWAAALVVLLLLAAGYVRRRWKGGRSRPGWPAAGRDHGSK
jgi:hypothetical protein